MKAEVLIDGDPEGESLIAKVAFGRVEVVSRILTTSLVQTSYRERTLCIIPAGIWVAIADIIRS